VLIWRILTYYIYVAHGAIVVVIDSIQTRLKSKRKEADISTQEQTTHESEKLNL